jgi:hypothetical protein
LVAERAGAVIIGGALFFAMPQLGIRQPPFWGLVSLDVIGLIVAGGVFVCVLMGGGRFGQAAVHAEAALKALSGGTVIDEAARLRHAGAWAQIWTTSSR